jgi:hypothetical protein
MWSWKYLPMLKNFLWKLGSNILATRESLFCKGIVQDPFCPFCLTHVESAFHALWSCPASVAVWQECGCSLQKMALVDCDGMQLNNLLKERLDRDEFILAMLVMRSIWFRRNVYVFQGKFTPPCQVILKAKSWLLCVKSLGRRYSQTTWQ